MMYKVGVVVGIFAIVSVLYYMSNRNYYKIYKK